MQNGISAIRLTFAAVAAVAILVLVGYHGQAGPKGTSVPVESVVMCIAGAAFAGFACARFWRPFPAPFVSAIAGALAAGPFGGLLGFCDGVFEVSMLVGQRQSAASGKAKPMA